MLKELKTKQVGGQRRDTELVPLQSTTIGTLERRAQANFAGKAQFYNLDMSAFFYKACLRNQRTLSKDPMCVQG